MLSILSLAACSKKNTITCDDCYAIVNISTIDVEQGKIDTNMSLIIQDNYILEIGKSSDLKIPTNATKIDGKEKFLIPGLWDMHVHTSTEDITRELLFPLFIANGLTGVRIMAADCFEPCWELDLNITQTRRLQQEVERGEIIGPKTILASFYINEILPDSSTVQAPLTAEHGRELVHILKERNVDFIKIYDDVPREAYLALAKEANLVGLDFAGHVPFDMRASEVSKAGQKSIEHCCEFNIFRECSELEDELRNELRKLLEADEVKNLSEHFLKLAQSYDSVKCQKIYSQFAEQNTWFVPTLRLMEVYQRDAPNWRENPNLKYLPLKELEFYEQRDKFVRTAMGYPYEEINRLNQKMVLDMQRSGVGLLAGSDCGETGIIHGFSLHEELESLVNAGLSPLEALQTATINPALFLEATDSLGSISKGKLADLVILDDNPLSDITNTQKISGVITNGRYFNKAELDSLLLSVETNVKNNFK